MPDHWRQLKDAFDTALRLAPELRRSFVDDVFKDNVELRGELGAMLERCDPTASILSTPTVTRASGDSPALYSDPPAHPRFQILRRLGEGGMGVVYLALDRDHQAQVALKTIANMSAASLLRFKNEFRSLADVVHPNLVQLFELLGDGTSWFFTMEHVAGVALADYVHPLVDGKRPLAVRRLRAGLAQIVEAVATIHAAGKLHCDLKPSNLLVVPETGRVVVLDFGLITEIDPPRWTSSSDTIAGTAAFMSPEQARGDKLHEATDWYGVGVILYQALTGRLPIEAADVPAMLARKQQLDPPSPASIDPTLPPDLSRLCMDLLARDPRRRPDGRTILERLERPATRPELKKTFVGRDRQLAELHRALREVRAGNQQTVYVHGPSGVGKTALIERFLLEVGGDALVLRGRCYERESVPFKAFDAVMDDLAKRLVAWPHVSRLLGDDVAHLARVFPVLNQLPAVGQLASRVTPVADPQEVRRRAFGALRQLLRRLAGNQLLIVAIDDLQWSDIDSAELLDTLLAWPHAPRLLFVASYRGEPADTKLPDGRLADNERAQRIEVGLLPNEDCASLVANMLAGQAPAETIATVVREAGGIPLFVEQLVHAIEHMSQTVGADRLSLDLVLRQRIARLEPTARRLLEHVAVAGQPLPQGAVVRAAGITPEQALAALVTLRAQQWVRTEGIGKDQHVEPFHDRVRESITTALAPEVLRECHLALADALEPLDVDPEILAIHWSGAGRLREATRYATLAAVKAAETLAFNRAARLYALALGWQPSDSNESLPLRVGLATALAHAGRSIEAGDAYLSATRGSAFADALAYKERATEQYLNHGHVEKGFAVLTDLVQEVGLRMPPQGSSAVVSLLAERIRLRVRGLTYRQPKNVPSDYALRQIDVCLLVGKGLGMIEPIRGALFQSRALRLSLATGDRKRVALALGLEAAFESAEGSKTRHRVNRLLDGAEHLASELDDVRLSAYLRFLRGVTHYLRGEWSLALRHCRAAELLFRERCVNVWWEIDQSVSYGVWTQCYLGHLGEAAMRVRPLLEEARERGDRLLVSQLLTGITVLVPLSQDEHPEDVRARLVSGVQPWQGKAYNMPHLLLMLGLCQIDLHQGRGPEAWDRFDRDWPHLRGSMMLKVEFLRIETLNLGARCALAALNKARERPRLLAHARRAARSLERIGARWAQAYAAPIRAQLAMAAGDTDTAVARLTSAARQFDALDMRLHAAVANYCLADLMRGSAQVTRRAAAESDMLTLGIRNAAAMARILLPMFGDSED
jgi:hypothetical protein